jgi:O-antigen/teichoic acid export membrane protein
MLRKAIGNSGNAMSSLMRGDGAAAYLATTVVVNMVFIARSYVALLALDYRDLGQMAVLQTVILLIGTLQFGLLNGGYRLLCSATAAGAQKLVNVAFAMIGLIGAATLALGWVAGESLVPGADRWIIVIGVVAGIATLLRTWVSNHQIAAGELRLLNLLTMLSCLASMMPLIWLSSAPLELLALSTLLQPALYIALALIFSPKLRPNSPLVDSAVLKSVMATGILVFLSGLLLQLNTQIERYFVIAFLGIESLGHLYISILFLTLYTIVPNALQSFIVPKIVQANNAGDESAVRHLMGRLFQSSIAYCALVVPIYWLLAGPVVALAAPRYLADLQYVTVLLPGLLAFTILSSSAVFFTTVLRFVPQFLAFAAGTVVTIAGMLLPVALGQSLDLTWVTMVKSAAYAVIGLAIYAAYWQGTIRLRQFRWPALNMRGTP